MTSNELTTSGEHSQDQTATRPTRTVFIRRLGVVTAAVVTTLAVWSLLVQFLGLEVTVPQGPTSAQRHQLEATAVVGATAVASLAGWALLEVLERVTRSGMKVWTWTAGVIFLLFLPYLPGHSWTDRLVLTLLHVSVAAVMMLGMRRSRGVRGS